MVVVFFRARDCICFWHHCCLHGGHYPPSLGVHCLAAARNIYFTLCESALSGYVRTERLV